MAMPRRRRNLDLGMRSRCSAEELTYCTASCSLGVFVAASSSLGLVSLLLGNDPKGLVHDLQGRFPRAKFVEQSPGAGACLTNLTYFIDNPSGGLPLPLDLRGTAFQLSVWQSLCTTTPGKTTTYAELAQRVGAPGAVRAVAGACAANHLAVAIPCHRVVRSDGGLSGYRWGVERKRALLAREAGSAGRDRLAALVTTSEPRSRPSPW